MISRATHECDILVVWLNAVSGGCIAVRGDHSALTTRNMFKPSTMELLTQLQGLGSKYLVAHPPAVLTLLARHLGVEHPLVVVWGGRHNFHHHCHHHFRYHTHLWSTPSPGWARPSARPRSLRGRGRCAGLKVGWSVCCGDRENTEPGNINYNIPTTYFSGGNIWDNTVSQVITEELVCSRPVIG